MVQDEGCFGRMNAPAACWAPPGIRPAVAQQLVREYTYIYSAIAPALGQITSLILPTVNTDLMNVFLAHVANEFHDFFIVMQVDGAGWHRASDLCIPENIRFICQPAYSPELNPVEHLWDYLRENYFGNRAFDSLATVIDAAIDGLQYLAEHNDIVRSMTNFPHLQVIY